MDLDLTVPSGRLEDLLAMIVKTAKPLATGNVTLHSTVHLPPGHVAVLKRLTAAHGARMQALGLSG